MYQVQIEANVSVSVLGPPSKTSSCKSGAIETTGQPIPRLISWFKPNEQLPKQTNRSTKHRPWMTLSRSNNGRGRMQDSRGQQWQCERGSGGDERLESKETNMSWMPSFPSFARGKTLDGTMPRESRIQRLDRWMGRSRLGHPAAHAMEWRK